MRLALLLLLPLGCAASAERSTGVADAGVDTAVVDSGPPPTFFDLCPRYAKALCTESFGACCSGAGLLRDLEWCLIQAEQSCGNARDITKSGQRQYHQDRAAECLLKLPALGAKCSTSYYEFIDTLDACSHMFTRGTDPSPDMWCLSDLDCAPAPGRGAAWCGAEPDRHCHRVQILAHDDTQTCTLEDPLDQRDCEEGYYCPTPSAGSGESRCTRNLLLGAKCGADPRACGRGNVCRDGVCRVGAPVGTPCVATEGSPITPSCASWTCSGGVCVDRFATFASAKRCGD